MSARLGPLRLAMTGMSLALLANAPAASAATEQTLYAFPSYSANGCNPDGTLLRDAAGSLYGAAWLCGGYYNGTLFKLAPPAPGQTRWTLTRLYTFTGGSDGGSPNAALIMDANGAIYGTADSGGWNFQGVVFKLTPPAPGTTRWKQTVIHTFMHDFGYKLGDGANPQGGVIMDATGALYGTTDLGGRTDDPIGFGAVYKLAPPAPGITSWKETVLYRFAGGADGRNPFGALVSDGQGALYGTTLYGGSGTCRNPMLSILGCGTVFRLTPPGPGQRGWTKTTLHRFGGGLDGGLPQGRLFLDESGALYGTTYQGGTGRCTDLLLGTVLGCGTVFRLTPPQPGQTVWKETVLYNFKGPDGVFPQGGVIKDAAGSLYGTASGGGQNGNGLAFKLSPPLPGQTRWRETVLHHFHVSTSGDTPIGELVADTAGNFFGAAYSGGAGLSGTVFKIAP